MVTRHPSLWERSGQQLEIIRGTLSGPPGLGLSTPRPRPTPRPASDLFPTLSLCVGMQGLARPLLARAGTSIPRKSPQGFVPQFALEIASLPRTLLGSPSLADKGSRLTGQSGPGGVAQATAPKEE